MEQPEREGSWTGEDLNDLIWLMLHTGYRISDATFFDATRLQGNQSLTHGLMDVALRGASAPALSV